MKNVLILSLLLISTICNAKFLEGTIVFKDGHSESGFIKSFLEDKFFDFTMFKKFEQEFNLDDKSLKFKKSKDGEIVSYTMNDIKELQLKEGNSLQIYRPLQLKTIDKKGIIVDKKIRVWLPLIKEDKINLYGYEYISTSRMNGMVDMDHGYMFYFQTENSDFVITPFDNISLFNTKGNNKIFEEFLKYLFESCPNFYNKHPEFKNFSDKVLTKEEKKQFRQDYQERQKVYYKLKYKTLLDTFEFQYFEISNYIKSFSSECN